MPLDGMFWFMFLLLLVWVNINILLIKNEPVEEAPFFCLSVMLSLTYTK